MIVDVDVGVLPARRRRARRRHNMVVGVDVTLPMIVVVVVIVVVVFLCRLRYSEAPAAVDLVNRRLLDSAVNPVNRRLLDDSVGRRYRAVMRPSGNVAAAVHLIHRRRQYVDSMSSRSRKVGSARDLSEIRRPFNLDTCAI